jgi:hypothetical protein
MTRHLAGKLYADKGYIGQDLGGVPFDVGKGGSALPALSR